MFPMFSNLRFLKCVPPLLEFASLTNKLANGFNMELLTTTGTGTGENEFDKTSTESDKEATTLSTREFTTKLITLPIESTESKVTSASFFFLLLDIGLDLGFLSILGNDGSFS